MNLQQPCFQSFAPCATLWQKLKVNVPKPKNVQIQKIINSGKMKKLTMVCMSALLLLAVSCKKDNEKLPEIEGAGFTATIELQDDGSKTHLVPGTNTSAVRWDAGDAILVCSQSYPNGYVFTSKTESVEADGITAHFFGTNIPDAFYKSPYTAFYGNNVAVSGGTYTLNVPATQNAVYNNNAFQNNFERGINPMAARSDNRILEFKNICGMLELKLYSASDCYVDQIVLTATGGEKLNGNGTVTIGSDGLPSLGTLNGNSTITLNCGHHLLSKSSNNPSHFYFILPPVNLASGFSITVKEGTKVDTRTVSTAINIQRSHIKPMEKLAVAPAIATPKGAVKGGVFTVNSSGKQVYFSMGNLTYEVGKNGAPGEWNFYENQYESRTYCGDDLIDSFTWGYSIYSTTPGTSNYQTGNFEDWGKKVVIQNGEDDPANPKYPWRSLTPKEWHVLYDGESDGVIVPNRIIGGGVGKGHTWIEAEVSGVSGVVIFPDGYPGTTGEFLTTIPNGCLFIPKPGFRSGYTWVTTNYCVIWTPNTTNYTNGVSISINGSNTLNWDNPQSRSYGMSVRLVQDVP